MGPRAAIVLAGCIALLLAGPAGARFREAVRRRQSRPLPRVAGGERDRDGRGHPAVRDRGPGDARPRRPL